MEERVIADVRSVLAERGQSCRAIEFLSPAASGRKRGRYALRVDLDDGSTIKVRCLESVEEASRLWTIRGHLPTAFAPVLDRRGAMLFEVWIPGYQLSDADAAGRAGEIGGLLGRLHGAPAPGATITPTRSHRDRAEEQLGVLGDCRALSAQACAALRADLRQSDPGEAAQTFVHLDYCPQNIVVDPGGALHVVDNEWIRVDAAGLDLGRTYARWPTDDDTWRRFLRGYVAAAPCDPGALRFWMIAMAAKSAVIRMHGPSAKRAVPLARLHELASAPQS